MDLSSNFWTVILVLLPVEFAMLKINCQTFFVFSSLSCQYVIIASLSFSRFWVSMMIIQRNIIKSCRRLDICVSAVYRGMHFRWKCLEYMTSRQFVANFPREINCHQRSNHRQSCSPPNCPNLFFFFLIGRRQNILDERTMMTFEERGIHFKT